LAPLNNRFRLLATAVMPVFDYMDVVGKATQEAKAENWYDVHECTNVAVIWISKSDPVNISYLYSSSVIPVKLVPAYEPVTGIQ